MIASLKQLLESREKGLPIALGLVENDDIRYVTLYDTDEVGLIVLDGDLVRCFPWHSVAGFSIEGHIFLEAMNRGI